MYRERIGIFRYTDIHMTIYQNIQIYNKNTGISRYTNILDVSKYKDLLNKKNLKNKIYQINVLIELSVPGWGQPGARGSRH